MKHIPTPKAEETTEKEEKIPKEAFTIPGNKSDPGKLGLDWRRTGYILRL